MNRDDIIRMAQEADDFADSYTPQYVTLPNEWSVIRDERFFLLAYAAGAAAEREACAKECEEVDANPHVVLHHAVVCAAAIRARGQS